MYQKRFSLKTTRSTSNNKEDLICGVPVSCCLTMSEDSITVQNGCPSVREIHEMYVNGLPTPESRKGRYSEKEGYDVALDGNIPFEAVGNLQRAYVQSAKELKAKEDLAAKEQKELEDFKKSLEEDS